MSSPALDNVAGSHLPYWTPGSGHFGDTLGQMSLKVMQAARDLVLENVDTLSLTAGQVVTIGDYGANDGSASMELFTDVIGKIKAKYGEAIPIRIIYEDQERNDFNSLFARLCSDSSYMSKYTDVYPLAASRGFYHQCVPDNTVHICFTSMAANWLEDYEPAFKQAVFAGSSRVQQREMQAFKSRGARDWEKFLSLRAREMKPDGLVVYLDRNNLTGISSLPTSVCPGGLLVALSLGSSDDFRPSVQREKAQTAEGVSRDGLTAISRQGRCDYEIYVDLESVWEELKNEGVITQAEHAACNTQSIMRNSQEIVAPFADVSSPVRQAGLTLVHHDQVFVGCVYKDQWRNSKFKDEKEGRQFFAQLLTQSHRVHSQASFESALSSGRTVPDKKSVMDQLFRRFQQRVSLKDPQAYRSDIIISRLVARKQ